MTFWLNNFSAELGISDTKNPKHHWRHFISTSAAKFSLVFMCRHMEPKIIQWSVELLGLLHRGLLEMLNRDIDFIGQTKSSTETFGQDCQCHWK